MKSMCVCNSAHQGLSALTTNFRKLRKVFGLAIAAIGLSASIASAATITVINGNFETEYGSNTDKTLNWVKLTGWSLENTSIGLKPISGNFSSSPDGGSNFTRFTWNNAGVEQNLRTNVSAGATLSVTFNLGVSLGAWDLDRARVKGNAYFLVGSTYYKMPYDLSLPATPATGVWYPFTFTTTINNSGALSLGFQNLGVVNNYYTSLDGVSDVTLTPAANDPNAPSSANATLTVDEDTISALTTNNFGYSDPNTNALAAVQITSLPALGTLKLSGTAVTNNEIVAVADINAGYLTYLAATNANASPYTTIGIKVMNASNLWSLAAVMTVNVTAVNDVPTSTGGSLTMRVNTTNTFAAANFQFSDIDVGNTLGAIKVVTLLPAHGTLKLNGTPITEVPSAEILVASITNLTYTPNTDYVGADSFKFQVRDAALFSADATLAITVMSDILVQNGSFETPGALLGGPWARFGSPWSVISSPSPYQQNKAVDGGIFASAPDGLWVGLINVDDCPITAPLTQNLGVSVTAGDTLTVTFQRGNPLVSPGGAGVAYFDVAGTKYTTAFDTSTLAAGGWQLTTMTHKITNSGNLTLGFYGTTGHSTNVWVDAISNVSVTPEPPKGTVIILW